MRKSKYNSFDELPLMLTVEDVSHVLGIGLAHAYEVAHRRDFPTITLGSRIIVPRDKFMACTAHQRKTLKLQWLQGFFVALKGLFVPRLFHYAFFFPKLTGSDAARPALASACAVSKAWE